jgi:hypothetical protein
VRPPPLRDERPRLEDQGRSENSSQQSTTTIAVRLAGREARPRLRALQEHLTTCRELHQGANLADYYRAPKGHKPMPDGPMLARRVRWCMTPIGGAA